MQREFTIKTIHLLQFSGNKQTNIQNLPLRKEANVGNTDRYLSLRNFKEKRKLTTLPHPFFELWKVNQDGVLGIPLHSIPQMEILKNMLLKL